MKSRTNRFLTISLFTLVSALVASSFYLWYTQDALADARAQNTATRAATSAGTVSTAGAVGAVDVDNGAHFWPTVINYTKDLWPRLLAFADTVYYSLVKLAYQYKLNLLWKYRHKITVLSIVGLVCILFLLALFATWVSYLLGKRRGRRDVIPDPREAKKKR